eukprot:488778-Amphidinium_carterae.1
MDNWLPSTGQHSSTVPEDEEHDVKQLDAPTRPSGSIREGQRVGALAVLPQGSLLAHDFREVGGALEDEMEYFSFHTSQQYLEGRGVSLVPAFNVDDCTAAVAVLVLYVFA